METEIEDQADGRRMIARLAVATMLADGRVTGREVAALGVLDELGLGRFEPLVREELERSETQAIDLAETCVPLRGISADAAALIVGSLVEVAAADRQVSDAERRTLQTIAAHLGVPVQRTQRLIEAAAARRSPASPFTPQPDAESERPAPDAPPRLAVEPGLPREGLQAFARLGLEPTRDRARVDAAYLGLVDRFDPARVANLGPEFVVLAVRKLDEVTAAYESIASLLDAASPGTS